MNLNRRDACARNSLAFALALISVAVFGCSDQQAAQSQSKQPGPTSTAQPTKSAADEKANPSASNAFPKEDPPLHGWKSPAAAVLLTGEQHGYFEPCGCALHQLGGMARRGDMFRQLIEVKKWNVVGLDLGGTLKRSRRQDQIKLEMFLNAFKHLHYAGLGLGVEELRLGSDFLFAQQPQDAEAAKTSVPFISANVQLYDPPLDGWPLPFKVIQVGDVKIGVTSILGLSLKGQVAPEGSSSMINVRNPEEVLPDVIAKLKQEKPAFLLLLSHGSEEEAKKLAEKFPQFQIILTAGGPDEPDAKPVVVGKTWILEAGHKGKRVGVLGYYPDDAKQPFKYDLIRLDDVNFNEDPYMRTLMRDFQQQIQDEGLDTSEELVVKHPSGNKFVGAQKCGECHKKAYAHWKDTKHAEGLQSLKVGHPSQEKDLKVGHPGQEKDWIVRIHDPECLSCHVTGWNPQEMLRYESGYFNEEKTPYLASQQCENCHGPGSKHVSLEEALAAGTAGINMDDVKTSRMEAHRTVEMAKKQMCVECHDADNSPKFKLSTFDEFWDQVKHPWKD